MAAEVALDGCADLLDFGFFSLLLIIFYHECTMRKNSENLTAEQPRLVNRTVTRRGIKKISAVRKTDD